MYRAPDNNVKHLDDFCKLRDVRHADNHSFFAFSSVKLVMHADTLFHCCTVVKGFIHDLVPVSLIELELECGWDSSFMIRNIVRTYPIDFRPFQFPKIICVVYEVAELKWKCEELGLGFMGAFYCHNWNLLWTLCQGRSLWSLWRGRLGVFILLIPPYIFFYCVKYLNVLVECSNLDKCIQSVMDH